MECFIVEAEDIDREAGTLILRDEEAHHALKSLRLRVGEELLATDLNGTAYACRLDSGDVKASFATCMIDEVLEGFGEPKRSVRLIQGVIAQPARWEFLLEKATELGVAEIVPVITERTERQNFKQERSERILRAAVKQTKRSRLPRLMLAGVAPMEKATAAALRNGSGSELSLLSTALSDAVRDGRKLFLLHESADFSSDLWHISRALEHDTVAVAVGPEGGFSDAEVAYAESIGASIVSLGSRRLRAETAAIAALAILIDR